MTMLNEWAPVAFEEAYAAAHSGAIMTDRSNLGVLLIKGETRLDLLHRMSTQNLVDLPSGSGAATILTSDIGRIIDRLLIYATSDSLYVLTGENNGDNVARYLMRFVFFNDDFQLQDIGAENRVLAIYGPQADKMLQAAGFPEVDLPLHHWRQVEWDGQAVYLHRTDPILGHGYFVLCHQDAAAMVAAKLRAAGIVAADEATFEYLRVEAGLPRYGHEMTTDFIPLEVDLWDDVSFNKGCYIGQEIIARMESRGRLAKKLFKLLPAGPIPTGATIRANGKNAGTVTSVAAGPDGVVALGLLKNAYWDGTSELTADEVELTLCVD